MCGCVSSRESASCAYLALKLYLLVVAVRHVPFRKPRFASRCSSQLVSQVGRLVSKRNGNYQPICEAENPM